MKLSTFLMTSGFLIGLLMASSRSLPLSPKKQEELLAKLTIRCIAALKSSESAIEKSAASYLRETASKFHNDLRKELSHLLESESQEINEQLAELFNRAEEFQFFYEYNEALPFDGEYIKHQLHECRHILAALHQLTRSTDNTIKEAALRNLTIFSVYQSALDHFRENFLSVDEHRIRDFAHQIWESEGRPEGQAARHWAMAIELSKKLTSAELQLAFEQKRSAIELLSTTRFDQNIAQETIH